ncbi:fasciclin domain-containing protein [Wenzhouxiangella marina]|uniref:Beta-Ig-H3/fasciclin n=1 Tax=Wenzhouxiangella marina TaxID=1579979 RepID=A0A0K0XS77_9GAMM|nr:fasciclin domain-containing protein [Wenzhouxiangella marina]AKS40476.1 Beta-Ig-H3/fasciclin [Wenzhouxiangella marina]MBB6088202.1 putative surface protein with fasciclin (FAS1) repeats [Wenzhouxiangella marina]
MFIRKAFFTLALILVAISPFASADHHGGSMKKNIVETAVSAGNFNTLVAAVQAAGLVDTLSGEGPFTVFAPTDEAFAKIPADDLQAILADTELLTSILTYHVVAGKVMASDVVNLDSATTVQGSDVDIEVTDEGVKIDGALVTVTDIETSNGVIHVIDTVITP